MTEVIKQPCVSFECKGEEREFQRLIWSRVEYPHVDVHHIPAGPPQGGANYGFVVETPLPVAACTVCTMLVHIGPTPEEVHAAHEEAVKEAEQQKRQEKTFEGGSLLPFLPGIGKQARDRVERDVFNN